MKEYKAYAKVNVFLKITGMRGGYHEILSRFMRVDTLYDRLSFTPKSQSEFDIIGQFSCAIKENSIYKAYEALYRATQSEALVALMQKYAVKVEKSIPAFAGLGGGSSDAATYLKMCNEILDLGLSRGELATIGVEVGADVPFFVYEYASANVSGIGEVVEPFDEVALPFEIYTPEIEISTPKVYQAYREYFYAPIDSTEAEALRKKSSKEIITTMKPEEANDLFAPALREYPQLAQAQREGYFFSGSGSSFFRVKEEQ